MKKLLLIFCLFMVFAGTISTFAGVNLKVTPTLPKPLIADGHTRIPVQVKVLNTTGKAGSGEDKVMITTNRGGFSDPRIIKEGLPLTAGVGKFEFIAPNNPGLVVIKFVYAGASVELKLNFAAVSAAKVTWQEQKAETKTVRGEVLWQDSSNVWKPLRPGIFLGEGNSIRTGEKGWLELRLADQSELTLEPDTELSIQVLKVAQSNPNLKQSVFLISKGQVLSKVSSYTTPGSKFEIGTKSASAGVRGTIFEINAGEEDEIKLSVFDGTVDLFDQTRDRTIPVRTGELLDWKNGEFDIEQEAATWQEREEQLKAEMLRAAAELEEEYQKQKAAMPNPEENSGELKTD
jgi:hypothetical protein